jgi:hypothetical protein
MHPIRATYANHGRLSDMVIVVVEGVSSIMMISLTSHGANRTRRGLTSGSSSGGTVAKMGVPLGAKELFRRASENRDPNLENIPERRVLVGLSRAKGIDGGGCASRNKGGGRSTTTVGDSSGEITPGSGDRVAFSVSMIEWVEM